MLSPDICLCPIVRFRAVECRIYAYANPSWGLTAGRGHHFFLIFYAYVQPLDFGGRNFRYRYAKLATVWRKSVSI